jgi:TatD DNase family protein
MLVDTHCHLNLLVEYTFDVPLSEKDIANAHTIVEEAAQYDVGRILNVGTSLIESLNSIKLAQHYKQIYASVGIHPNDLTETWKDDLHELQKLLPKKETLKILALGESGIDKHYKDYNLVRQQEAFIRHIELALEYDLALVVHTRDAGEETLRCLEPYKNQGLRGTIHCFSEDLAFAQEAISYGFVLGIGGTLTYPKNSLVREVVQTVGLDHIILETDAPFLPPQIIRGQKNRPRYIKTIAHYLADLLEQPYEKVSEQTTANAFRVFRMM